MYQGGADLDEAAAAFGLVPQWDTEEEDTECYPDNWPVLELLRALNTQWNMSSRGTLIGLRYEVLPGVMDLLRLPKRKRPYAFWALTVMESAAMEVLNKRRG